MLCKCAVSKLKLKCELSAVWGVLSFSFLRSCDLRIELCAAGVFGTGANDERLRRANVLFTRACKLARVRC